MARIVEAICQQWHERLRWCRWWWWYMFNGLFRLLSPTKQQTHTQHTHFMQQLSYYDLDEHWRRSCFYVKFWNTKQLSVVFTCLLFIYVWQGAVRARSRELMPTKTVSHSVETSVLRSAVPHIEKKKNIGAGSRVHSERRGRIATAPRQYFCQDHGVRSVGQE